MSELAAETYYRIDEAGVVTTPGEAPGIERSEWSAHVSTAQTWPEMPDGKPADTAGLIAAQVEAPRIIRLPARPAPPRLRRTVTEPLQEWEGVVTWVKAEAFGARLTDLTEPGPDEEAEFGLGELSEGDRPLLEPGAVFYWTMARRVRETGQVENLSFIRFRRLPAWTRRERNEAELRAKVLSERLGLN